MDTQSPGEMKRFGALAAALRLAGSLPLPYPRRADVAAIAAYASEGLEPFAFGDVRLVAPTRTFSGQLELDVGGREVRLLEVGPAHTEGDLIVWVPDERIAIAADILFIGVTPIMWAGPLGDGSRRSSACSSGRRTARPRTRPGLRPGGGPASDRLLALARPGGRGASRRRGVTGAVARARPRRGDRPTRLRRLARPRADAGQRAHDRRPSPRAAKPPGPRELIDAFFRMALLARDLDQRRGRG